MLFIKTVPMELINKVKTHLKMKNYSVAKALRSIGIDITVQGIDCYEKQGARAMRLDVLTGLRRLSGKSWEEFGIWLDKEFLEKEK